MAPQSRSRIEQRNKRRRRNLDEFRLADTVAYVGSTRFAEDGIDQRGQYRAARNLRPQKTALHARRRNQQPVEVGRDVREDQKGDIAPPHVQSGEQPAGNECDQGGARPP